MKVLGIGEVVLDRSIQLKDFLNEGEKVDPDLITYSVGGPVASALILLSKLGLECSLITSIGKDRAGDIITETLASGQIKLVPHIQDVTKVNTVLINRINGSRTIIKDRVTHKPITNIPIELIESADLIVSDRHEPKAFQKAIYKKNDETKVVVDPSTEVSPKTLGMLRNSDYPIVPIETLTKLTKQTAPYQGLQHLYALLQKPIVVTAGELGSFLYDGQDIQLAPAYDIDPVDVVGAGDVYRGAFGYGLLQGWDLPTTLSYANKVAALQCTKVGNGSAIPGPYEIDYFEKHTTLKHITVDQLKLQTLQAVEIPKQNQSKKAS